MSELQHVFRHRSLLAEANRCEARALREVGEIARAIDLEAIAADHETRAAQAEAQLRSRGEPVEVATRYLLGLRDETPGALTYCAKQCAEQAYASAQTPELRAVLATAVSALFEAHRLAERGEP